MIPVPKPKKKRKLGQHGPEPLTPAEDTGGEALFTEAERRMGDNASALVQMSLLAYEHRGKKPAMRLLSSVYGRNARRMSIAVARYPDWFFPTQNDMGQRVEPRRAEPDELIALFEMCQLSKPQSDAVYREWRAKSWRAWQVREKVETMREEVTKPASIRLRSASLTDIRANSATLKWEGEKRLTDFKGKTIGLTITDKTRVPDTGSGEDE